MTKILLLVALFAFLYDVHALYDIPDFGTKCEGLLSLDREWLIGTKLNATANDGENIKCIDMSSHAMILDGGVGYTFVYTFCLPIPLMTMSYAPCHISIYV